MPSKTSPPSRLRNCSNKKENQKSEIRNQKSEIRNQKSEIRNRKSEIGNQKSEIGNRTLFHFSSPSFQLSHFQISIFLRTASLVVLTSSLLQSNIQHPTFKIKNPTPTSPHPALGIDHGAARIGLAATDDFGILAHPVETIECGRVDPVTRIGQLVVARGIHTLVLGLPLRMDGSEGDAAAKVRAFAAQLHEHLPDLPLVMVDESLTTASAAAKLHQAGRNTRQQKSLIDQAAAVEILNLWMEENPI